MSTHEDADGTAHPTPAERSKRPTKPREPIESGMVPRSYLDAASNDAVWAAAFATGFTREAYTFKQSILTQPEKDKADDECAAQARVWADRAVAALVRLRWPVAKP